MVPHRDHPAEEQDAQGQGTKHEAQDAAGRARGTQRLPALPAAAQEMRPFIYEPEYRFRC